MRSLATSLWWEMSAGGCTASCQDSAVDGATTTSEMLRGGWCSQWSSRRRCSAARFWVSQARVLSLHVCVCIARAIRCVAAGQRLTAGPAGCAAVPRHVRRLRAEDGCGGLRQVLPDARTHHLQIVRHIRHVFSRRCSAVQRPRHEGDASLQCSVARASCTLPQSAQMRPISYNAVAGIVRSHHCAVAEAGACGRSAACLEASQRRRVISAEHACHCNMCAGHARRAMQVEEAMREHCSLPKPLCATRSIIVAAIVHEMLSWHASAAASESARSKLPPARSVC